MIILGITGTIGAGKGTVVDYLVKNSGFHHFSARDFLIKEVKKRGLEVIRDNITDVADDLRKTHSPSYIIENLLASAKASGQDSIVESIRALGEVDYLRKNCEGFILLSVDADPKIRYERIKKRGSVTDSVSYEKFMSDELRESTSESPWRGNLPGVGRMADYHIANNSTLQELEAQIENFLNKIINNHQP